MAGRPARAAATAAPAAGLSGREHRFSTTTSSASSNAAAEGVPVDGGRPVAGEPGAGVQAGDQSIDGSGAGDGAHVIAELAQGPLPLGGFDRHAVGAAEAVGEADRDRPGAVTGRFRAAARPAAAGHQGAGDRGRHPDGQHDVAGGHRLAQRGQMDVVGQRGQPIARAEPVVAGPGRHAGRHAPYRHAVVDRDHDQVGEQPYRDQHHAGQAHVADGEGQQQDVTHDEQGQAQPVGHPPGPDQLAGRAGHEEPGQPQAHAGQVAGPPPEGQASYHAGGQGEHGQQHRHATLQVRVPSLTDPP